MEKKCCSWCKFYAPSVWLNGGLLPFCVSNAKCLNGGTLTQYYHRYNKCKRYEEARKWWRLWIKRKQN